MESTKKDRTKITIAVVCGVRPQFVKCAAFQKAVAYFNLTARCKIVDRYINAGQHYDDLLSGVFIRELNIRFDFTIQHLNKKPTAIVGHTICELGDYLDGFAEKPDWVILFGDANTTVAGAIAANKSKCRIAHFEAGVALQDMQTPETINAKLISQLATVHFCPTKLSADRLAKHNINKNVFVIGDLARDFVIEYAKTVPDTFSSYSKDSYILVTIHREENLESDEVLSTLLEVLNSYSKTIFITHPRTMKRIKELHLPGFANISFIPALPYREMLSAINGSRFIVTDSGGIQREAYYLRKRCLVCSDVDFWPSLRIAGVHRIISADTKSMHDGLVWMENQLKNEIYPSVEDMNRSDVGQKSLEILTNC